MLLFCNRSLILRPQLIKHSQYFRNSKMSIKAALIDLSGTLHVEDEPTPNAVDALKKLT